MISKSTVEKRLQTEKAKKHLPDEVRAYLLSFDNYYKANSLVNYAYAKEKETGNISVQDVKTCYETIDSIYNPDNDIDYYIFDEMCRHFINTDLETLKRYNQFPCESKWLLYAMTKLLNLGMSDSDITSLLDNIRKTEQRNEDAGKWNCINVFQQFELGRCSNTKNLWERYINSKLIQEMLKAELSFSLEFPDFRNKLSLIKFCENNSINDLDRDKYGNICYKPSDYYKDLIQAYAIKEGFEKKRAENGFTKDFLEPLPIDLSKTDVSVTLHNINFNKIDVYFHCHTKDDTCYTSVNFYHYYNTKSSVQDGKRVYFGDRCVGKYTLLLYDKDNIYIKIDKAPARPVCLYDLYKICKFHPEMHKMINELFSFIAKENPFFKVLQGFLDYCITDNYRPFPIALNKCFHVYNWRSYFTENYKAAKTIDINYNSVNPLISYALIKISKAVPHEDLHLFMEEAMKNPSIVAIPTGREWDKVKGYITKYYMSKLKVNGSEQITISDWLCISHQAKVPISLRKTNMVKIRESHDKISYKQYLKEIKRMKDQVLVPENSVYEDLRKMLPDSFEWIKNKKRLYLESAIQHHCVWSYHSLVAKDKCAIYSYILPQTGTRHTIEFQKVGNQYKIQQIQKAHDRGYDPEIMPILQKYLYLDKNAS